MHVSERRDMHSAILCLRKAKYIAGKPEIIVTDGWYAYPKVIRKVFGWRKPRLSMLERISGRNWFCIMVSLCSEQ